MQKTSHLVSLTAGLVLSGALVQAQDSTNRMLAEGDVQSCFEKVERLTRLECYDTLLARPQMAANAEAPEDEPQVERVATVPLAIAYASALSDADDVIGEQVSVSLRSVDGAESLETMSLQEGGLVAFLKATRSEEETKSLRLNNDLFLTLESDVEIGEFATLILSCENNISRLKIVFSEPFEGKFAGARFYGGQTLTGEGGLPRKLWVRGQGYMLENARGLDAIKLIAHLVSGTRSQVAVGDGDTIRSAFFETDDLRKALPLLARHCSWSSGIAD